MSESPESERRKRKLLGYFPSAYLLGALLLQLLLFTLFDKDTHQHALISVFGMVVLMVVMWVIDSFPTVPWLKWCLAIPAVGLSLAAAVYNTPSLIAWSALLNALFYFYALVDMVLYMLSDDRVTTDELFAIVASYMLLAWGFGYLYMMCQMWVPNSFVSSVVTGRPFVFVEMLFISFTNQSSTGLSDISPASSWARTIMMLDQMSGGIYIAVIVARLVSMIARKRVKKQG